MGKYKVNIMNNEMIESYEYGIPHWLTESIDEYNKGKDSSVWDCLYCQLQADINVAEQENLISSDQAWYLREKYLGLKKEDNYGFYK